jgi:hypothetical protein
VAIGLLGVDPDTGGNRAGKARLGPQHGKIIEGLHARDPVKPGLGRGKAGGFDGIGIEEGAIGVENALFVARKGGGILCGEFIHQRLDVIGALLAQQGEGADAAEFRRERIGVDPRLVGIGVEVIARLDVGGEIGGIEAPGAEADGRQGGGGGLGALEGFGALVMRVVIGQRGGGGERKQARPDEGGGLVDHGVLESLRMATGCQPDVTVTSHEGKGCALSAGNGFSSIQAAASANCSRASRA